MLQDETSASEDVIWIINIFAVVGSGNPAVCVDGGNDITTRSKLGGEIFVAKVVLDNRTPCREIINKIHQAVGVARSASDGPTNTIGAGGRAVNCSNTGAGYRCIGVVPLISANK